MKTVVFATSSNFLNSGTISFMSRDTTTIRSQSMKTSFLSKQGQGKKLVWQVENQVKLFQDVSHLNSALHRGAFSTIWSGNEIGTGVPPAFKV